MKLLKPLALAVTMILPIQAHALYSAKDITDWSQVRCDKVAVHASAAFSFYLKGKTLREIYPVMGQSLVEDSEVGIQTMRATFAYLNQGVEAISGSIVRKQDIQDITISYMKAVNTNCTSMKRYY